MSTTERKKKAHKREKMVSQSIKNTSNYSIGAFGVFGLLITGIKLFTQHYDKQKQPHQLQTQQKVSYCDFIFCRGRELKEEA